MPVHRVARPQSKAAIVCDVTLQGAEGVSSAAMRDDRPVIGPPAADRQPVVLFVDDTLAEHLDADMRNAAQVIRFLFTRSKGSAC